MSTSNRIVCIVDDDPSNILFFHEALKGFSGITVLTFRDPLSALKHFQEFDYAYALVISDLKMERLDGMDLLKSIKDVNPLVRTILITATFRFKDKRLQEYTKKRIIDGFVQKPIGLHDFLKEVDTQLPMYETQKRYPIQW
jgi:DNA-binding NtrC family response regulator